MKKQKSTTITVRIPDDLLEWMDEQVDGIDYRTRTHLILKALSEYKMQKNKI